MELSSSTAPPRSDLWCFTTWPFRKIEICSKLSRDSGALLGLPLLKGHPLEGFTRLPATFYNTSKCGFDVGQQRDPPVRGAGYEPDAHSIRAKRSHSPIKYRTVHPVPIKQRLRVAVTENASNSTLFASSPTRIEHIDPAGYHE